jgi:hypothetical protein
VHLNRRADDRPTDFVFAHRDLLIAIEVLRKWKAGNAGRQGTQEEINAKVQRRKVAKGREEMDKGKD